MHKSEDITQINEKIDRYLLGVRWGVILAAGVISQFEGFPGQAVISPTFVWFVILAINLLVSAFVLIKAPFSGNNAFWIFIFDLMQSSLAMILTGGYSSAFYVLSLMVISEASLFFRWKRAIFSVISIASWFTIISVIGQKENLQAYSAFITVSKFAILLIIGLLVATLGKLIRSEEKARLRTSEAVDRMRALNNLFYQLGESHLNLDRTLETIIQGTQILPQSKFALILLPFNISDGGDWVVAASNFKEHHVGERLRIASWEIGTRKNIFSRDECPFEFANWISPDSAIKLTVARLMDERDRIQGYLVVGHTAELPLNSEAEIYLESLAQEASFALRNARIYTTEKQQIEKLKQFERLQKTFFSAIGHELKTPLAVLKMLLPSLKDFSDLPKDTQTEILTTIDHNLDRLERQIRDLLESTRLEAGNVSIHKRSFNINRRIQQIILDMQPLAKNNQQTIQYHAERIRVYADPARIDQILINLLHNAIKFSPKNSEIQVKTHIIDDKVNICVLDNGPGIPPDEITQIFDKFYIVQEQATLAGIGLGLFICRELLRLHNEKIWVKNREKGGSEFCFSLPIAKEDFDG